MAPLRNPNRPPRIAFTSWLLGGDIIQKPVHHSTALIVREKPVKANIPKPDVTKPSVVPAPKHEEAKHASAAKKETKEDDAKEEDKKKTEEVKKVRNPAWKRQIYQSNLNPNSRSLQ